MTTGDEIARMLHLMPARQDDGSEYDPPRYYVEGGTMTADEVLAAVSRNRPRPVCQCEELRELLRQCVKAMEQCDASTVTAAFCHAMMKGRAAL